MDPLLPLNWLVAAARFSRLAAVPNVFSVVAPNFSESSENTTRMAFGFADSGTKPTLTASDIGKSSKNQGFRGPGRRRDDLLDRDFKAWSAALWPAGRHNAKRSPWQGGHRG